MNLQNKSAVISGIGTYVPKQCVRNDELPSHLETNDEWIRTRTGIEQRYLAGPDENSSDMGVAAAEEALKHAKVGREDIDLLVVATMSPDYPFPATACIIQSKLGLKTIGSFDVHAACSGFIYALEVTSRLLQAGHYRHALLIGSEKMSALLDWHDRSTCVLFGDGAGAAVLSSVNEPHVGVIDNLLCADGARPELLYCPTGGVANPVDEHQLAMRNQYLKMNGKEIFKVAVRLMAEACDAILERNNYTYEDVHWVVPHQANTRIIESLAKYAKIPSEKLLINIDRYANTSAASIPLTMAEAVEEKKIQKGDLILLVAFGGGLTWATSLIKWQL